MMILKILKAEIARLRREESGVALMLTLSVFLLLYVVCAGVYSIGETVRQKVELQNACDSAAYSTALIQADGLSRMAMVNRAMSWTYVQLTNLQIDYITYRWLELVVKRFNEDYEMCKTYNRAKFTKIEFPPLPCPRGACRDNRHLTEPGIGWFCGIAGKGMKLVRLNGHSDPYPVDVIQQTLQKCSQIANYPEQIIGMKDMIVSFNEALRAISIKMHESMAQTPSAVLYWNLPKDENGEVDKTLASDFLFYQSVPFPIDEDGHNSPYDFEDTFKPTQLSYFSPLYNTECDERIFLTMADGKVFDTLTEYFGPTVENTYVAGGLDQWFIRTYTNEVSINSNYFFVHPRWGMSEEAVRRTYANYGICRAYKNANRVGEVQLSGYRDHHRSLKNDAAPSCLNTQVNCPEQCRAVPNSVGLVAEYEWSSGRYDLTCYHVGKFTLKGGWQHLSHVHYYDIDFLGRCNGGHNCSIRAGSHRRSDYMSCVADSKDLKIPLTSINWPPIPVLPLPCSGGFNVGSIGSYTLPTTERDWVLTEWIARFSNVVDPNGFARIYGDDKELIEKYGQFYYGTPAKPWVLNSSFYGKEGATIVGFARKQRNPWVMLFNSISEVISSDKVEEGGIYSAFNPMKDGYIVAFSAARAAHRFHPSPWAQQWLAKNSKPQIKEFGVGEYETRYDAVCDDGYDDGNQRFAKTSDAILEKIHVGCVCNNKKNCSRLARCWNLCETDWDATLLPLRYAWADVSGDYYDSLDNAGDVYWESVGRESENDMDPLEFAAASPDAWARFFDASGNSVQVDAEGNIKSEFLMSKPFLYMRAPFNVQQSGSKTVQAPYSSFDIEEAQKADGGVLDLSNLYKIRVL